MTSTSSTACGQHRSLWLMDVTERAPWSQPRLEAGSQTLPGSSHLSRGSIHLYLLLRQAGPTSLTLCGAAGELADLLVWELTTPAVQSANGAVFLQVAETWQPGMLHRIRPQPAREIVSSPAPWLSVGGAARDWVQSTALFLTIALKVWSILKSRKKFSE